ncbi:MAG: ABC transporter permease subunit [Pseudomonadota bacterium]
MRWINRTPNQAAAWALAALPFVAIFAAYAIASDIRLAANPSDKLLPAPSTIYDTALRLISEPDRRSGEVLFWKDTLASLWRLGLGVGLSAMLGLVFGMAIGLLPYIRSTFATVISVLSMVPPLAILPILFIIFGLGEVSKVALIVIGIAPFLIRDMALRVSEVPTELVVKAQTLGASSWVIALRVAGPQVLPRLFQSVRLSLGPAWLFLIASEAIAAEGGLGYRIFLVRRYLAMDVILTYVIWITLLAFVIDFLIRMATRRMFPWFGEKGA